MTTARFTSLAEMFERLVASFSGRDLFCTKRNGRFTWLTYGEVGRLVDDCRSGLAARGIGRGDKVRIVSNNRVEWAVLAYAALGLGAVVVPMYEAQQPKEWTYIATNCGASVVAVGTAEAFHQWQELREHVPTLRHLIGFSLPKSDPNSYQAILDEGKSEPDAGHSSRSSAPACFIYTSGTTANPKGVVLSHRNLLSTVDAVSLLFSVGPGDVSLSFLPWAHSFGHTCELHALLSLGVSMALCEGVDKILPNLAEVAPTVLLSVPRIFNKIYDGVNRQMAEKPLSASQHLLRWPQRGEGRSELARGCPSTSALPSSLPTACSSQKIRAKFGGRLRFVIPGGLALSREVGEFIDCLGIHFDEGYGLTETSPLVSVNCASARLLGERW